MIKNRRKPQTNVRKKKLRSDLRTRNTIADSKKAKLFVKGMNKSVIEKSSEGVPSGSAATLAFQLFYSP